MLKKNGEISHFMESACFVLTGRADLMGDKKKNVLGRSIEMVCSGELIKFQPNYRLK